MLQSLVVKDPHLENLDTILKVNRISGENRKLFLFTVKVEEENVAGLSIIVKSINYPVGVRRVQIPTICHLLVINSSRNKFISISFFRL